MPWEDDGEDEELKEEAAGKSGFGELLSGMMKKEKDEEEEDEE